jgi:hypothetical protein
VDVSIELGLAAFALGLCVADGDSAASIRFVPGWLAR